ncbi:MAG: hypothetical protein ABI990_02325 [Actinomycetota bacterium]
MHPLLRAPVLVAVLALGFLASGCGGRREQASTFRVVERDFAIKAPRVVRAGLIHIVVKNRGPVAHELVLIRITGHELPVRTDGFTIDEDSVENRLLGAVEPQPAGIDGIIDVRLKPGRYLLFCNMAGHFAAGMQKTFVVR